MAERLLAREYRGPPRLRRRAKERRRRTEPRLWCGSISVELVPARYPAAAKLYLNRRLSKQTQSDFYTWSVRTDVKPPPATAPSGTTRTPTSRASSVSCQTAPSPNGFRQQLTLYVGEVNGDPSPGWLGLHPGQ